MRDVAIDASPMYYIHKVSRGSMNYTTAKIIVIVTVMAHPAQLEYGAGVVEVGNSWGVFIISW